MDKKYKVITLCGSTRFKPQFQEVASYLTMMGYVVLMPHCYSHFDEVEFSDELKEMFIETHKQMIDMSDEVFIVDVEGYIGETTANEIKYAKDKGKKLYYYSKPEELPELDD